MLDQNTIDIVKSTVPFLKEYCLEITTLFYNNIFKENEYIKELFDMSKQASGEQPKALAMAILLTAQNIDNLSNLTEVFDQIAKKHCEFNVKSYHYIIVGEYLLKAIKEVLKDNATNEVLEAWNKTYNVIAKILIDKEKEIYNLRKK